MYQSLLAIIDKGLDKQVPATGLGLFRIFFSLVVLQEVCFLLYFRHLIFDPVPYIDSDYPLIPFLLALWAGAAVFLALGLRTRSAAILNYLLWVLFVVFTPMARDFDGGFDQMMIGSSLLLIFLPSERAFSLDSLRAKLRYSSPGQRYRPPATVSVLAYYLPVLVVLGLLYFDSAFHKLSAPHWRNGLGAWLPSSMPYYVSVIDMSWLLNLEILQKAIGYTIIVYQFLFLFLCCFKRFRVAVLAIGVALHLGITLSFNIYPFGLGMLVHFILLVPFAWWRRLGERWRLAQPRLTVFYDEQCPLCNRTVICVSHFDGLGAIEFRGLQTHARDYQALAAVGEAQLLKDLYALDTNGRLYAGLDTYIRMLRAMGYPFLLGRLLQLPGIHALAGRIYRRIADSRTRLACDASCAPAQPVPAHEYEDYPFADLYRRYAGSRKKQRQRIARFLVLIAVLQLNSTLHFGILMRSGVDTRASEIGQTLGGVSNLVLLFSHTFLGVTPHALYLHDHFDGYNHILALTYRRADGSEAWLPFVNQEGRMLAPNWGRVHSMWANVAVTPNIDTRRLYKFIEKVTAFWGTRLGMDLNDAVFTLKLKQIEAPFQWQKDLRRRNLSGPWRDIGTVVWKDEVVRIETPGVDLAKLSRTEKGAD